MKQLLSNLKGQPVLVKYQLIDRYATNLYGKLNARPDIQMKTLDRLTQLIMDCRKSAVILEQVKNQRANNSRYIDEDTLNF